MSTMYTQQPEDPFFGYDDPANANAGLFPELSGSYESASQQLLLPPGQYVHPHSGSFSGSSDLSYAYSRNSLSSSRPPSLSPSSTSMPSLHGGSSHSPHLSSSPHSNSSFATDESMFLNQLSSEDINKLLPGIGMDLQQLAGMQKPGASLFLPGNMQAHGINPGFLSNNSYEAPLSAGTQSSFSQDGGYDVFGNPVMNLSPAGNDRRFSTVSAQSAPGNAYPVQPAIDFQLNSYPIQQTPLAQSQGTMPPQLMQRQAVPSAQAWTDITASAAPQQPLAQQQPNGVRYQYDPSMFKNVGPGAHRQSVSKAAAPQVRVMAPAPRGSTFRREIDPSTGAPTVGKHNKTERRYRQKVQAAQADLRDSVPALRVLYGTSDEQQKQTTDFRADDGTIDGIGEIGRPNASAKTTIFIGARLYIESLLQRNATLLRKVQELEAFRSAVGGEANLKEWHADFSAREAVLQAQAEEAAMKLEMESGDDDDEEEEEEEDDEPRRKKARTAAKPTKDGKKAGRSAAGTGARVFAAFAMSFSFLPSAPTALKHVTVAGVSNDQILGHTSAGQVLSRLPMITAEHTSRLLARGLPLAAVPHPHTLVDWTWRLLLAVLVAAICSPLIARWTAREGEEERPVGSLGGMVKDAVLLALPVRNSDTDMAVWNAHAASIIGRTVIPGTLARWQTVLRLNRTATDAYSLALMALLQPRTPLLRSPEAVWQAARVALRSDAPSSLATVLALPFEEAQHSLLFISNTASPVAAIAEQVTLVHLNDLYSRLFVKLVEASTQGDAAPLTVTACLENLEKHNLSAGLKSTSFDTEIKGALNGISKGTAAHALGLVLIGLWGGLTGSSAAAQGALASALAAEEVKGTGASLPSVSAMLELLYPGSSARPAADSGVSVPQNALAIDKLALVCIDYIRLLSSATAITASSSRLQRIEASRAVQQATGRIRLLLTQTAFVGLDEASGVDEDVRHVGDAIDGEMRNVDAAKEKLVGVLSVIGRRAARRSSGSEDSGLGTDSDDL